MIAFMGGMLGGFFAVAIVLGYVVVELKDWGRR